MIRKALSILVLGSAVGKTVYLPNFGFSRPYRHIYNTGKTFKVFGKRKRSQKSRANRRKAQRR